MELKDSNFMNEAETRAELIAPALTISDMNVP